MERSTDRRCRWGAGVAVTLTMTLSWSVLGCARTTSEIASPSSTGFTPATAAPAPPSSDVIGGAGGAGGSTPSTATSGAGELGPPTVKDTSTVSTVGLDKVTFGMTKADAERAAGSALVPQGPGTPACELVSLQSGVPGVSFLLSNGRVERVDVASPPIATRSGAKVGSTVAQVKALYPGQIQDQPRPDGQPGGALVFVPKDAADADFRLVFSTDGTTVVSYRAGRIPAVLAATGCR